MNVGLVYSLSKDISMLKGTEMNELSNQVKNCFKDKTYGESVEEYLVG